MIPKRAQIITCLITALLMLTSCRKQNVDSSKKINREIEIKEIISKANKFYNNHNNTDSAFFYYNKARVACNLKKDLKSYVSCMYYMAEIQQDHEDFVGSIKTAMETVPLLDELNNSDYIWNIYSVLGRNYYYTYDYPTAIYYYSKAFTLKTNKINKLEAKNNIAVIYIKQQKFDKALPIFVSISNEKIVQQNPENYSKILDYIGYCYYKLKNSKALTFFEMSLKIKSKANYTEGLGRTYYNLAEYYQNDKADLAMKYAKLSYKNYTLSGNTEDRLLALKFIIENSSDIDSKKNALLYTRVIDSIFEVRQRAKNQFAKIKYDSKKEKEENLKLKAQKIKNELQIVKQQSKNIVSYIIIVLASCLIVFLYFFLTLRNNRQKIEATYQSEIRISKKLHDELANDIYHTMAFVENRNLTSPENRNHLLKKLDNIYSRTKNISKDNTPAISDHNYVASLKDMISGFDTPNINILVNGLNTINWDKINEDKKTSIYRTIQELFVNMKKHSDASLAAITFKVLENIIIITYTDNGKGIDKNKMILRNGLSNIENRIHAVRGDTEIHSGLGKGFKVIIKVPV